MSPRTQAELASLSETIARHGLSARKSLGQHFLLDPNLCAKIARAAGPLDDFTVLEVGPGPGGLTRALLAAGAKHVVAIERDRRCIAALEELSQAWPERLEVIEGDALKVDAAVLAPAELYVVCDDIHGGPYLSLRHLA